MPRWQETPGRSESSNAAEFSPCVAPGSHAHTTKRLPPPPLTTPLALNYLCNAPAACHTPDEWMDRTHSSSMCLQTKSLSRMASGGYPSPASPPPPRAVANCCDPLLLTARDLTVLRTRVDPAHDKHTSGSWMMPGKLSQAGRRWVQQRDTHCICRICLEM